MREKLFELIKEGRSCPEDGCPFEEEKCASCQYLKDPDCDITRLADYLIANGVTVQNGKPLESFLHPVDAYNGLKEKYLVFKADTGEKVENCFVLRPDKDSAAVVALRAYAEAADNDILANDIYNWVGKDNNVPSKWIPVAERLPKGECIAVGYQNEMLIGYIGKSEYSYTGYAAESDGEHLDDVTHWMPLPEQPKGGKDNA